MEATSRRLDGHGRRVRAIVVTVAVAVAGSPAVAAGTVGASTPPSEPVVADAAAASFPVVVEHQLGTVSIPEEPTRVVAMSTRDADALLALGVIPVGIHSIYDFDAGVGPWAIDALGDAAPEVWNGREFNFEAVAATEPDLIVFTASGADQEIYDTLSEIAPTIDLPLGAVPWGADYEESTLLVAEALGRSADGERVVAGLDEYLADQAVEHPSFGGRTANYLDIYPGGISSYSRDHNINAVLYDVGFDPIDLSDLPDGESSIEVSAERLAEFDADVVLAYPFERTLDELVAETPTLASLDSFVGGRFFVLEDLALSNSSVLSIPYALDRLLPEIAAALDGA